MEPAVNNKKESTVKDFLEVIFRRKWIIIGIVAVSSLVVFGLGMREPALYESISTMLVQRGQASGVYSNAVRTLPWEEEMASQLELVKSQIVIDSAREKIKDYLSDDYSGPTWINMGNVETGVISTSNVLWVKYVSGTPALCEAAVKAITNSYKQYYVKVRTPPEMDDFFSQEAKMIKEEIEYWRNRKEDAGREWGIVDLEAQRRYTLQRINQYESDLDEIIREKERMEEVLRRLTTSLDMSVEEMYKSYVNFSDDPSGDTEIDDLYRQYQDKKLRKMDLSLRYTENNRELTLLREEIEEIEKMMRSQIRTLVKVKKTKIEMLSADESLMKELLANLESIKKEYSEKEVEIDRINSALSRLVSSYDELIERQMEARISLASNPEWSVTILSPATPAKRQKTKDYVRMALGPFFSLLFSVGFAFFIDNLDHSIKNVSEAEEAFGISVLASFPDAEKKK